MAVSTDGKKVAAGFENGLVVVWDVATGTSVWTRNDPGLSAMSVAFSPDGKWLVAGYGDYSENKVGRVEGLGCGIGEGDQGVPGSERRSEQARLPS